MQPPPYHPYSPPPPRPRTAWKKWVFGGLALVVLCCGGGVAFFGYRLYDRISAVGRADRERAEANVASCEGKSYLGAVPDEDRCADASHTTVVNSTKVTVTAFERAGTQSCTGVTVLNTGAEPIVVSPYSFLLQRPAGQQETPGLTRAGRELETTTLAGGGNLAGRVCFDTTDLNRAILIWDATLPQKQRGIWFADELSG